MLSEVSRESIVEKKAENDTQLLDLDLDNPKGEITPGAKINNTNVTIFDVMADKERFQVDDHMFIKKCNHQNKCHMARCKPP